MKAPAPSFELTLARLRAAGEATRLRALLFLAQGELTVSELTGLLAQSQPRVSRHLRVLADAGLVAREQEGAWVFYRLEERAAAETLGLDEGSARALLPSEARDALTALKERRAATAAAYFAAHAADWEALRRRHIAEERIEETLRDLAGENGGHLIDLGTGTGRMLIALSGCYDTAAGYDLSPEMLAIARSKLAEAGVAHAHVRRADFLSGQIEGGARIVCLHHVLHFLADPGAAIGLAASLLAPGGSVLIADFAPHDHEDLREAHAHRRLGFRDAEIAGWARKAGLSVTADERLDPPRPDGLITRIWRLTSPNHFRKDHPGRIDLPPIESHILNA